MSIDIRRFFGVLRNGLPHILRARLNSGPEEVMP